MFQKLKSKCCKKILIAVNRKQFGAKDYQVCSKCHSEFKIDDITPMEALSKKVTKSVNKKSTK